MGVAFFFFVSYRIARDLVLANRRAAEEKKNQRKGRGGEERGGDEDEVLITLVIVGPRKGLFHNQNS